MLALRSSMSESDWQAGSLKAQTLLIGLQEFRQASSVALYSPIMREVDTTVLFDFCLETDKKVYYPLAVNESLVFHTVSSKGELLPGRFGILEPCIKNEQSCLQPDIDLMVIPGVAFDMKGHRLGFGKGYYDRYIAGITGRFPVLAGLCHNFQLVQQLPSERHDMMMDFVVNDVSIVNCCSNRLSLTVG